MFTQSPLIAQAQIVELTELAEVLGHPLYTAEERSLVVEKWKALNFMNEGSASLVNFETITANILDKTASVFYRRMLQRCAYTAITQLQKEMTH